MNNRCVFISRELSPDSPIIQCLADYNIEYEAFSLIEFSGVAFILPKTEWIFFYSKKGVEFFISQLDRIEIINNYKIAIFGSQTARYFETATSIKPGFIGNADSQTVAHHLVQNLKIDAITFICGRKSLRSVQKLLPTFINAEEIIVYSQEIKRQLAARHYHIAIMTSPLNVRSFVDNGCSAESYISIGNTTSKSIPSNNTRIITATEPSENGIAEALKRYLATS